MDFSMELDDSVTALLILCIVVKELIRCPKQAASDKIGAPDWI